MINNSHKIQILQEQQTVISKLRNTCATILNCVMNSLSKKRNKSNKINKSLTSINNALQKDKKVKKIIDNDNYTILLKLSNLLFKIIPLEQQLCNNTIDAETSDISHHDILIMQDYLNRYKDK